MTEAASPGLPAAGGRAGVRARGLSGLVALAGHRRVPLSVLFLVAFPFLVPSTALATQVLTYGLYALGFNLLFGYLGVLSFGHAALFGAGAYLCGMVLAHLGLPWWIGILAGVLAGALTAALIGLVALRSRGIYFAMVTLALAQCVYYVAYQATSLTGGENGLRLPAVGRVGPRGLGLDFVDPLTRYGVTAIFVAASLVALSRILASPFGAVMAAVRENEARARACGYDVNLTRLLVFVLSGAFCGLAGALEALRIAIVPVELLGIETSGLAVMMCLLGGMGTFFGPFVGAALFLVLENVVSVWTVHWQLAVGAVFVACVLFFPKGVWGSLVAWGQRG